MMQTRRVPLCLVFALVLLGVAGCGPKKCTIKGTLVMPPNVKLEDTDHVVVGFAPEGGTGQGGGATVTISNLSFETPAPERLSPGKYKVTVFAQPYGGGDEKRKAYFAPLNEKYSEKATPLTYEVTNDSVQTITVDVAKGEVKKQ